MNNLMIAAAAASALVASSASDARPVLSSRAAAALVQPYYDAVTGLTPERVRASAEAVTTASWHNCSDEGVCETRDQAIKRWSGIRKLIPDVSIVIREVLVSGNKIVVRGEMTGTPAKAIFGVEPHGRSFKVMTTDIHELAGSKIAHSYHLENWGRGIEQLRGISH